MKFSVVYWYFLIVVALILLLFSACGPEGRQDEGEKQVPDGAMVDTGEDVAYEPEVLREARPLDSEFKDYWYAGDAEITSYRLSQGRYGKLREGTAVLVYVTEPFLPQVQVKADRPAG